MSRRGRKDSSADSAEEVLPWYRRPGTGTLMSAWALLGVLGVAVYGLERLKDRMVGLPEYNPQPRLELIDTPPWLTREQWQPQILASIHFPQNQRWLDEGLARDIGQQLQASGWVSRVRSVTQHVDGTIRIACDYRRPIAMIRSEDGADGPLYVAVDREGVRLPQVYEHAVQAGWMEIVGVEAPVPPPGQPFIGEDAVAAIRLADLIFVQDFAPRIGAINVSNFRGRLNKREPHIFLLAKGDIGRLPWGSAIGEEYDEPTPEEKLRSMALTLKNAGSRSAQLDPSIFPDRVILRVAPDLRTADSSQPRDR